MPENNGFCKRTETVLNEKSKHKDLKEAPMGILLKKVEHAHDMKVRERLDACGITKAFGPFLMTISKNEGATQSEIADRLNFTAATVSVTIQKLLDSEYITRVSDDSDCRQLRIYLTDKGRSKSEEMHKIFRELEEELVSPLTFDEREELRRLLLKISEKRQ